MSSSESTHVGPVPEDDPTEAVTPTPTPTPVAGGPEPGNGGGIAVATPLSARPSIREVAALAGVSHQTVSRVINAHPGIRPDTRERVLKVIAAVNYRPSGVARALATRRSKRIGVVVDSAGQFGPNATLRAIEQAARGLSYSVSAVTTSAEQSGSATAAVDHLMAHGVDALCIIAPRASSVDPLLAQSDQLPTLVVSSGLDTSARPTSLLTASVDQRRGAELAVEHLIGLGHERILHVSGPTDWLDAQGRELGWRTALERAGLDVLPVVVGDWSADFAYDFARGLAGRPDFTAIFCANDQMSLGLLHGLGELGLSVPGDVSVVGFDDLAESRHFHPPLTTIRQDFQALGHRVVQALIATIEGRPAPRSSVIEPVLVVRDSTAPPPAR